MTRLKLVVYHDRHLVWAGSCLIEPKLEAYFKNDGAQSPMLNELSLSLHYLLTLTVSKITKRHICDDSSLFSIGNLKKRLAIQPCTKDLAQSEL